MKIIYNLIENITKTQKKSIETVSQYTKKFLMIFISLFIKTIYYFIAQLNFQSNPKDLMI